MKRLAIIQQRLKAPKDQNNSFGKFMYRKASDILEAVKPLLAESNLSILLNDKVEVLNGIPFLTATASLYGEDGMLIAETSAFAQMDAHKGMTAEQATGAASSYARKYALCGLFAIDDSKDDPDSLQPEQPQQPSQPQTPPQQQQAKARPSDVLDKVHAAETTKELTEIWESHLDLIKENDKLRESFTKRKNEILARQAEQKQSEQPTQTNQQA